MTRARIVLLAAAGALACAVPVLQRVPSDPLAVHWQPYLVAALLLAPAFGLLLAGALPEGAVRPRTLHGTAPWLPLLACGQALFCITLMILQHNAFSEGTATYEQAAWNVSHGIWTQTQGDADMPLPVLGLHFTPLTIILSWAYRLCPHPFTLYALQSLAVAAGALGIAALASRESGQPLWGQVFGAAYLLHPLLLIAQTSAFAPDVIASPCCVLLCLSIVRGERRGAYLAAILLLCCKESYVLVTGAMGLYWIGARRRRDGAGLLLLSMGWFLLAMTVKHAAAGGYEMHQAYREHAVAFLLHPLDALLHYLRPERSALMAMLCFSTGYLGLLAPEILALGIPVAALAMAPPGIDARIALDGYQFAVVVPIAVWAAARGMRRLSGWANPSPSGALPVRLGAAVLTSTALAFAFLNPTQVYTRYDPDHYSVSRRDREVARILAEAVPAEASVSFAPEFRRQLARRETSYLFFSEPDGRPPNPAVREALGVAPYDFPWTRDCDFVVLDLRHTRYLHGGKDNPALRRLLEESDYGMVRYWDGLMVFRRGTSVPWKERVRSPEPPDPPGTGERLRLHAVETGLHVRHGGVLGLAWDWDVQGTLPGMEDVELRLTWNGTPVLREMHTPFLGLWPASDWEPGRYREELTLQLPPWVRPSTTPYLLEARIAGSSEPVHTSYRVFIHPHRLLARAPETPLRLR
ncbi:MAG: DUF2079 domain-containing protein [Planctomycetes bacterium]|nr:DUF2079 domain-containing protein [Planctomycetota bacterium]